MPARGGVSISPFCSCSCSTNLSLKASESRCSRGQDSARRKRPQAPATKGLRTQRAGDSFCLPRPVASSAVSADLACARGEPRGQSGARRLGCCVPAERGAKLPCSSSPPQLLPPCETRYGHGWAAGVRPRPRSVTNSKRQPFQSSSASLAQPGAESRRGEQLQALLTGLRFTSRCLWVERRQK